MCIQKKIQIKMYNITKQEHKNTKLWSKIRDSTRSYIQNIPLATINIRYH